MKNYLFFSDHIKQIAENIRFYLIVSGRFIILLFRRKKGIKLLYLEYANKYQFDNSYLIIRYSFRNALFYNFKNVKKTTDKQIIIFNLNNVPSQTIELTVYGFFKSTTFNIEIKPEWKLQNNSFKTAIKGIKEIEIYSKPILLKEIKPTPRLPKIKLNHWEIQIKQPTYNQTDFL